MIVTDAHLHLFPDEAPGLRAQGGQQLAGHTGIGEEERLLSQAREQNAWICQIAAADPRLGAVSTADPAINATPILADPGDRSPRPEAKAVKFHRLSAPSPRPASSRSSSASLGSRWNVPAPWQRCPGRS